MLYKYNVCNDMRERKNSTFAYINIHRKTFIAALRLKFTSFENYSNGFQVNKIVKKYLKNLSIMIDIL